MFGTIRRASNFNTQRIESLLSQHKETGQFTLFYSDLLNSSSLTSLIQAIQPDEIYNLAAQSRVAVSFKNPQFSINTSTVGSTLLEAVKNSERDIRSFIKLLHLKCMEEKKTNY